jgi:hypothetical protein
MVILPRLIEVVAITIPLNEGDDCLGDDPLERTINRQLRMSRQELGIGQPLGSRIKLTPRLRRPWPYGKDCMGIKIVGTHETAQGKMCALRLSNCPLCVDEKFSACKGHIGN